MVCERIKVNDFIKMIDWQNKVTSLYWFTLHENTNYQLIYCLKSRVICSKLQQIVL